MKTVCVAAAVIRRDGRILATQRGYGPYKDSWEFPGGKIERGETPKQALKRELLEELDATIRVDEKLTQVEWDYPEFHLSMACFLCTLTEDGVTLLEHEDAKWLDDEALDSVDWLPADRQAVAAWKERRGGLVVPKPEDLWFRQRMLSDPDTMSYNHAWGGTIDFPEERWAPWYDRWVRDHGGKRYYRYVTDPESGCFAGEIAWHLDEDTGLRMCDVLIAAWCRGRGIGRAALRTLCEQAAADGIDALYDDIASDNPAIRLFLEEGFVEKSRTDESVLLEKRLEPNRADKT